MISGVNEVGIGIATHAGKEVVTRAFNYIFKKNEKIESDVQDAFKIDGQEMTIICPEGKQKYSMLIIPKSSISKPKSKVITNCRPVRVELKQMMGFAEVPNAIQMLDDGFKINAGLLSPGETYILEIENKIEDPRFLDHLVDRNKPRDIPHDGDGKIRRYEISAQLKFLDVLKRDFGAVKLRDLEMNVDVAVYQDVNTSIPKVFRDQLETLVKFSKSKDKSKAHQLMMRHLQLQQSEYGGNSFELLRDLQDVFDPFRFQKYVDVKKDFHYRDCRRGAMCYDSTLMPNWPKLMTVISRTDLSLNKAAADGIVEYNHATFKTDIEDLFDEYKKYRSIDKEIFK